MLTAATGPAAQEGGKLYSRVLSWKFSSDYSFSPWDSKGFFYLDAAPAGVVGVKSRGEYFLKRSN